MINFDMAAIDAEYEAKVIQLDQAVIESFWSENGELTYVLRDGTDLLEYADLTKSILEINRTFDTGVTVRLKHSNHASSESFILGEELELLHEELYDAQEDIEYCAVNDFEGFIKNPATALKLNGERYLEYLLPENVTLEVVAENIDAIIKRTVAGDKSFSIGLISGNEQIFLTYPKI